MLFSPYFHPSFFFYLFFQKSDTKIATIQAGASIAMPIRANRNKSSPSQEFVFEHALCVVAYNIIANQVIIPAIQPLPVILSILFYPSYTIDQSNNQQQTPLTSISQLPCLEQIIPEPSLLFFLVLCFYQWPQLIFFHFHSNT